MNDEKIFSDLQGILHWIEFKRNNDTQYKSSNKPKVEDGIKEVIQFLEIEERDEEVEALKEYLLEKNPNDEFDIQGINSIQNYISVNTILRLLQDIRERYP